MTISSISPRIRYSLLFVAVVLVLGCSLPWLAYRRPLRPWLVGRTKPLVENIKVQVVDLQLLPYKKSQFLLIHCRYLGGDPNQRYILRASIRPSMWADEIDPGWMWQTDLHSDGHGNFPVIWEFRTPPENVSHFIFRIYFRRKPEPAFPSQIQIPAGDEHIDIDIPYFPEVSDDTHQR